MLPKSLRRAPASEVIGFQAATVARGPGRVVLEKGAQVIGSEVRGPAIIGTGTAIENSFVGPYTSIGQGCNVTNSALEHSVVLDGVRLEGVERMEDSILGRNAVVRHTSGNRKALRLLIGEDTEVLL